MKTLGIIAALTVLILVFGVAAAKKKPQQAENSSTSAPDAKKHEGLTRYLRNGQTLPLVGLGVGNLSPEIAPEIMSAALSPEKKLNYRLFDTSRASENERLIAETINGSLNSKTLGRSKAEVHVVTKVWYTHLGYDRTKLSVKESIRDLTEPLKNNPSVDLKIHVLLHWPRCYPQIRWMLCEEEEEALPQYVKDAGPSPLPNPYAWRDSWRALEDIYLELDSKVTSIGVSNFHRDDLTSLLEDCKVEPHLFQGNLDTVFELWDILWEKDIAAQMYHVFESLTHQTENTKILNARRQLIETAARISTPEKDIAPASLLIAHYAKNGVGMIPRTTSLQHLVENSPAKVEEVPQLNVEQTERMKTLVDNLFRHWEVEEGLKQDEGRESVLVTFFNGIADQIVEVFWVDHKTQERRPVTGQIRPGSTVSINSHPGHRFVVHNVHDGKEVRQFNVGVNYGDSQWFSVEL